MLAGGLGRGDGDEVIRLAARHPATARTIARKLCRRFVDEVDRGDLIAELSAVFLRTDGDIRSVLSTLFRSPHFLDRPGRKLKRPFHLVASALRAVAARSDGAGPLAHLDAMGHLPFDYPLPDGFPDHTDAWTSDMLGRWRFAVDMMSGGLVGTEVPIRELVRATGEGQPAAICGALWRALTGRTPERATVEALLALGGSMEESAAKWLALAAASPEFQWQ